jgi:hypothetical protein
MLDGDCTAEWGRRQEESDDQMTKSYWSGGRSVTVDFSALIATEMICEGYAGIYSFDRDLDRVPETARVGP